MGELSEMPKSEDELAGERMLSVERQLHQHLPRGVQRNIVCPYCGRMNFQSNRRFCCDLLRRAVLAVLMADRMLKTAEAAERASVN